MNQEEIDELKKEIWEKCELKKSTKNIDMIQIFPNQHIYDKISLFIDDSLIYESALNCIKEIAKKRRLKHHWIPIGSQKGLEIYTPKK